MITQGIKKALIKKASYKVQVKQLAGMLKTAGGRGTKAFGKAHKAAHQAAKKMSKSAPKVQKTVNDTVQKVNWLKKLKDKIANQPEAAKAGELYGGSVLTSILLPLLFSGSSAQATDKPPVMSNRTMLKAIDKSTTNASPLAINPATGNLNIADKLQKDVDKTKLGQDKTKLGQYKKEEPKTDWLRPAGKAAGAITGAVAGDYAGNVISDYLFPDSRVAKIVSRLAGAGTLGYGGYKLADKLLS